MDEHGEDRDRREDLSEAHEGGVGVELLEPDEVHKAGVVAQGVDHDLGQAPEQQEEAEDVPVRAAAVGHRVAPVAQIEAHEQHGDDEQEQERVEEDRERPAAGSLRPRHSEGQTAEEALGHGDAAAAGAAPELGEADEGETQAEAGGHRVEQAPHALHETEPPHGEGRRPHAEDHAEESVAAGVIVHQRLPEGGELLEVAVPVDHAGAEEPEDQREGEEDPDRRAVAVITRIERETEAEPRPEAERQDERGPVEHEPAGEIGDLTHGRTSDSGTAEAK